MDYERIEKPLQGGGLSPGKLRNILSKVEKKINEEDDVESACSLRSRLSELDETGGGSSDHCKDVDVDTVTPECFASTAVESTTQMFQLTEQAPQRVSFAPFTKLAPSKWDDAQKWIASPNSHCSKAGRTHPVGGQGIGLRKSNIGYFTRQASTKLIAEVPDKKYVAFEEPHTKGVDDSQAKKETGTHKVGSWESNSYPVAESYGKPVLMIENSVGQSAISHSQHNSSLAMRSATTFIPPPSTARSVSMRDMGTEMTPITSQEPSRTTTPVRATTPIRSPTSSRPSSPKNELSTREMQMKTRREIMMLGTQLASEQPNKSMIETGAAAWEEAEKAKYLARFKREEVKIQAWENHQKAKTEAEMRKIEVEVERMRAEAQDRIMNKLASVRHKAEEKRVAAEAKRDRHAAKAEQQADYIRRTGHMPYSFSCCGWCS
ncbi:hypothetical protein K2173_009296 [Erythroxylum novogranatense]|uniref:Remorin C-terminal domain-containing protein n=1 Tax=Erythroxylum novogranatense TaxID=1862640 RepID=A0AAV8SZT5_9ROSI|nr:hypothetical protein K2173_009296 [Erythroxylum novogranatense]